MTAAPLRPAQAECRQCEKLFCFFYRFKRRVFCGACLDIRRAADHAADNEFYRAQRRKEAVRVHGTQRLFPRFRGGGFILAKEHVDA